MKIKNQIISNEKLFIPAIERLLKVSMPVKTCMQLSKSITEINQQLLAFNRAKLAFAEQHVKKDESGAFINGTSGPEYKTDKDKEEFTKKYIELCNQEFDITLQKKIELTEEVKMTAEDYGVLESLLLIK